MAKILEDISRTFAEYLLIPRLTRRDQHIDAIDLSAPLSREGIQGQEKLSMNIPIVSACMQAVSGTDLAVALARQGGLSMIFCSQSIESQVDMVKNVKAHKAGFVTSGANIKPDASLRSVLELMNASGHSTIPVTTDGSPHGNFVGLITDQDFWEFEDNLDNLVQAHMTAKADVIYGEEGITLREANQLLHRHKKDCLPILSLEGRLSALVFKKDYVDHQMHPLEILDDNKRLRVGAAINTHDYQDRVPALIEAGADVLCFDSSDGFTEFQMDGVAWIREQFGPDIVIGGGNVVSAEGFDYLAMSGLVDFIKVGIGGDSIGMRIESLNFATLKKPAFMCRCALTAVWPMTRRS